MWTTEDRWEIEQHYESVNDADVKVNTTAVDGNNIVVDALDRISSGKKMRHVMAIMLKWKEILHNHKKQDIKQQCRALRYVFSADCRSSRKNFMAPFYGWGSTASKLEPLRGGSLLFTTKFPKIPGTHFTDLRRMKG